MPGPIVTGSEDQPNRRGHPSTPKPSGTKVQRTTRREAKGKIRLRKKLREVLGEGSNAGSNAAQVGALAGGIAGAQGAPATTPGYAPTPEQKAQVNAQTRLQYGPATQAARDQVAAVPGYFQNYRNQLSQLSTGLIGNPQPGQPLGGVYGAGLQSVGQLGQQLATGSAQIIGATRAAGVGQGTLDDAGKAAIVRQGTIGNYGGLITAQGLAEGTYLGNRQASSGPLQIQAQTAANTDLAGVKKDKGAYRVEALRQIRADAWQRKVDRAAAKLAGVELGADIAETTTTNRADRRNDRRDDRREARQDRNEPTKYGPTKGEWAKMSPAERKPYIDKYEEPAGGDKGLSPAEKRNRNEEVRKIKARIRDYRRNAKDALGNPVTLQQIKERLRDKYDYDPKQIQRAIDDMPNKYVTRIRKKPDVDAGDLPGGVL